MAQVLFLARFKPKIPFLGLSLLRNLTKTLATQANAYAANESSIPPKSDVTETENGKWKRGMESGNGNREWKRGRGKAKLKMGKNKQTKLQPY